MIEVNLKIRCPKNWVGSLEKGLTAPIKFLDCKPEGDGGRGLVQIDASGEQLERTIAAIRAHPSICHVDITPFKDGAIGTVVTNQCVACKSLKGSKCFLTSAVSESEGWVEWNLISGGGKALRELMDDLTNNGCEVELVRTRRLTNKQVLTSRQGQVIKIAYARGYYEFPKKVTLEDLAKDLRIAVSTIGEILQRAERKVIGDYLNEH